jgi:hypothetical protein
MIKEVTDMMFDSSFKRGDHKWSFEVDKRDLFSSLLLSKIYLNSNVEENEKIKNL